MRRVSERFGENTSPSLQLSFFTESSNDTKTREYFGMPIV